jgi:hypothetical protein
LPYLTRLPACEVVFTPEVSDEPLNDTLDALRRNSAAITQARNGNLSDRMWGGSLLNLARD